MNRIYKKILKCSIIALILFSLFTACLKIGHQTPVMIDRTIGWEPKVLYTDIYDLLLLDTNDPFFQSFLFAGSEITTINPVYINTSDDISVIMEYALKVAFGENYIDNGNAIPETKQFENHTDIFTIELLLGGETCVIIDSANGRVGNFYEHRTHSRPINYSLAKEKGLKISLLEDDQLLQEKVLSVFHATLVTFDVAPCVKIIENHLGTQGDGSSVLTKNTRGRFLCVEHKGTVPLC